MEVSQRAQHTLSMTYTFYKLCSETRNLHNTALCLLLWKCNTGLHRFLKTCPHNNIPKHLQNFSDLCICACFPVCLSCALCPFSHCPFPHCLPLLPLSVTLSQPCPSVCYSALIHHIDCISWGEFLFSPFFFTKTKSRFNFHLCGLWLFSLIFESVGDRRNWFSVLPTEGIWWEWGEIQKSLREERVYANRRLASWGY